MNASLQNPTRSPAVQGRPVVDPAGWTGGELAKRTDWIFALTAGEISGLRAMARQALGRIGSDPNGLLKLQRADFDLGTFGSTLGRIVDGLRDGPGLALIRGLPVAEMSALETAAVYWGIGRHLGRAISNNAAGDMLSHVMDLQKDYANPNQRGYQTRAALEYHGDQCDIVGLLCIHNSKSGGESKVVSAIAVYNEILRRRPELMDVLCQPYYWSKNAEVDPGETPFYTSPVFNFLDGYLCTSLGSVHMERGHKLPGAPAMTALQREAIAFADQVCEELHCPMDFRRGDIQLLNNSVILHTRTEFEDWPEPERKRRLLRMWISAPELRPQTPYLKQWRNGVRVASTVDRIVPLQ
ncbi:MAG TPA: TauD/TfdA family dioxygenase [Burkholderiales bacterium]|nr:TauD/TfdA family dioxygenase [Burkholderiales bacterium]